jgi:hypothetical protein
MPARTTFADTVGCTPGADSNTGEKRFRRDALVSLTTANGYAHETWFRARGSWIEVTMIGGGVSSAYLDDDCWPDLAFTGGDAAGMLFYRNVGGAYFEPMDLLVGESERAFTGTAIADLDGDYRREIVLGNIKPGHVPIFAQNANGQYERVASLPMIRPTFGISFAPLDERGNLYMYLAHWSRGGLGTAGSSPALWRIEGTALRPWDVEAKTTSQYVDQTFNFTPKFADFTGDGRIDLVVASDFQTSQTLLNRADSPSDGVGFQNTTDRSVITDENGMGSALLDIDNDGNLEWFVTSIVDTKEPLGNWGRSGNRLYRNVSLDSRVAFEDITADAGVRDGFWGWGACAADFDNNGYIDLFHVNGFGYVPDDVLKSQADKDVRDFYFKRTALMQSRPGRLFMNRGDGTFADEAAAWRIDDASEGRGVTCFDYDRDGDIDIGVFDHSNAPQFFVNESGSGAGRAFLNVRLVGAPPNTDAVGARVFVTADLGDGAPPQTQMRLSEANSNFNSQNTPDLHFGMGEATVAAAIEVRWPGGSVLTCSNVAVGRFIVLDERDAACP